MAGKQKRDKNGRFASGSGSSGFAESRLAAFGKHIAGKTADAGERSQKLDALKARVKAAEEALARSREKATQPEQREARGRRIRERLAKHQEIRRAQQDGIRGLAVPQSGLRPESFAHLRSGGAVHGGPPRIKFEAAGSARIIDGRHRIMLARERGDKTIDAIVYGEGKRGGVRWERRMKIPI